jgi:hypothetical protein
MTFSFLPPRRSIRARIIVLTTIAFLAPVVGHAQWPVTKLKNVQVLPEDITPAALVDTMRAFTRALGVRCTYCHVGKEGEPLSTFDFASDDKVEKNKARAMLRMVGAINGDYLAKLQDRRDPRIIVQCATCHRGVAQPRPLPQVLLMAYDAGGADSLDHAYRALRTRYYGSAAYDFGEVSLTAVADALTVRHKNADAVRTHQLNVEMFPNSAFALWQAGAAEAASGDTATATTHLRRSLEIRPGNPAVVTLLKQLGKEP